MFNYMIVIKNDLIFTPQSLLEKLQKDNLETKLAFSGFVIKQNKRDSFRIENGKYCFYLSLCCEYVQEEFQDALQWCKNKDYKGCIITPNKLENFDNSRQRIDFSGDEIDIGMNYINECIYVLESFVNNNDFIVLHLN